jgi:hypothetical protein
MSQDHSLPSVLVGPVVQVCGSAVFPAREARKRHRSWAGKVRVGPTCRRLRPPSSTIVRMSLVSRGIRARALR